MSLFWKMTNSEGGGGPEPVTRDGEEQKAMQSLMNAGVTDPQRATWT